MNYIRLYADFLKKNLHPSRPISLVCDCSNGTAGLVLKELFAGIPHLTVQMLHDRPDGNFPAHGPNPLAEGAQEELRRTVIRVHADAGVIFDADGDRVFFVDEKGNSLEPAAAILFLANCFRGDVLLPVNIGPFVRSQLLQQGRAAVDVRVGHHFVKQAMRAGGMEFAAEQSGHYYFKNFFYFDSGIFAAIQFANAVSALPMPLSEWIRQLPPHWISGEVNFEVADKEKKLKQLHLAYASQASRIQELDGLSMEFPDWWFNVRASNTENLIRLNMEATREQVFKDRFSELRRLIFSEI